MRILVTGGAGYIGSVTAALLSRQGHDVTVYDNLSRGHTACVVPGCRFVKGDIADRSTLRQTLERGRHEAVVHFAAYAYVGESVEEPERYLTNNVAGSIALFEETIRAGICRLVFSSSCSVYGTPRKLPLTEEHPRAPLSPYAASKVMCEDALRWLARAREELGVVCLRYFNAAGAAGELGEDHRPETHLIPLAIGAAAGRGAPLTIFGNDYDTRDGTCERDYVHVLDLADAHLRAVEAAGIPGWRVYNVGSGEGHTVLELLRALERLTGHPVPRDFGDRRPGDAPSLVANGDRIRRHLSWQPRFSSLERIITDAWKWHEAHPYGYPN